MAVQALVEGWNARDGDRVAAAFAPGGVRVEFARPAARLEGRAAVAAQVAAYATAVPDCILEVRGLQKLDLGAVLEWTFAGTHTGDIPGLEASGRTITLPGVSVYRIVDDLIEEERVYWDAATLFGLLE